MAKADALLPADPRDQRETPPIHAAPRMTETKIPTAAEIEHDEAVLNGKKSLVRTHALEQINSHIESLKAIGIFYTLTKTDSPAAPPKQRAAMKCGNCGQPGHRSNRCKTTVEATHA